VAALIAEGKCGSMNDRDTYEKRVSELLKNDIVRSYWKMQEAMTHPHAFVIDAQGRSILVGLLADETCEFLWLHQVVCGTSNGTVTQQRRYSTLRTTHEEAMRDDFDEYRRRKLAQSPHH